MATFNNWIEIWLQCLQGCMDHASAALGAILALSCFHTEKPILGCDVQDEDAAAGGGPFEDEDSRLFYESLPDLRAVVPGVALGSTSNNSTVTEDHASIDADLELLALSDELPDEGNEAEPDSSAEDVKGECSTHSHVPWVLGRARKGSTHEPQRNMQRKSASHQCEQIWRLVICSKAPFIGLFIFTMYNSQIPVHHRMFVPA